MSPSWCPPYRASSAPTLTPPLEWGRPRRRNARQARGGGGEAGGSRHRRTYLGVPRATERRAVFQAKILFTGSAVILNQGIVPCCEQARRTRACTRGGAAPATVRDPRSKASAISRDPCSSSVWEVVLPAPRRRRAAGRERQDLPSYVLFIAQLSRAARRDSLWLLVVTAQPTGIAAAGVEGWGLDRDRSLTSRRAVASHANGQGYGRAPDHGLSSSMAPKRFTTSVPCRTSSLWGAKGTAPLSV